MNELRNIAGDILCDATATFLNGAGLATGEDQNTVLPKLFKETINGRKEDVPYVSAQSWRRWLRDTSNEENNWTPSELQAIDFNTKGSTAKISTELNPIDYPEDDLFGYMKSGSKGKESIQRTSPFKTSILRGIRNMRALSTDDAFVFPKNGSPLPYSTKFYSTHLEGFFNLEYYRLGMYVNTSSRQELSSELIEKYTSDLSVDTIQKNIIRYTLKDAEQIRKTRAAGLLRGLAYLRGGAKMAAFGADVSPKVIVFAGLSSANPCFNNLFIGKGEKPELNIALIEEIAQDYADKLATPIHIGIRSGYLGNEDQVKALVEKGFVVDSPASVVKSFIANYLS
jgi:CRISPR-associated protein Cst2